MRKRSANVAPATKAAHRTPQEALLCAKAERQRQSAQPERKSIPHNKSLFV
ncbi:hypothetical protein ACQKNB_08045 [Lysinibacillus xylanilyticus]|uniref:hypothetical protein n=1 Tax=Lysinibacillus xylanilyticus TaxID=582475 RepID=UPI003D03E76D